MIVVRASSGETSSAILASPGRGVDSATGGAPLLESAAVVLRSERDGAAGDGVVHRIRRRLEQTPDRGRDDVGVGGEEGLVDGVVDLAEIAPGPR